METSRKAALAVGQKQYCTGRACVKGHVAPRRASTGECLLCRAVVLKSWRQANQSRVQQHNQEAYARSAGKIRQAVRAYYRANAPTVKAKQRAYQKANLHVFARNNAKRKAAKLQRTPKWLTKDDHWLIAQAYELAALRTKKLAFPWHVDHIIPLQGANVSGLHVPTNLRVIPGTDNRSKSNKYEVA